MWSLIPPSVEAKLLAKNSRFNIIQLVDEYLPRRAGRDGTPVIGVGDKLPDRSCIVGGRQVTLRRVKYTGAAGSTVTFVGSEKHDVSTMEPSGRRVTSRVTKQTLVYLYCCGEGHAPPGHFASPPPRTFTPVYHYLTLKHLLTIFLTLTL